MESSVSSLIGNFSDMRQGNPRSVAVFSPVGDAAQLSAFVKHAQELGIDRKADFVFIFRPGMPYPALPLSAFFAAENYAIGTSGCFFAGQVLCYELGYEVVVVADLDAFLDSASAFDSLVGRASERGKAQVPLSRSPQEKSPLRNYFVINQWVAIPRQVFEQAGFEIPYTVRGGEDWEFSNRLSHFSLLEICPGTVAVHPKEGMGVGEKMKNPKKYYPYLRGLMLAFAVASQYDEVAYLRFFAWFLYYDSFASMLQDRALAKTVRGEDFAQEDISPRDSLRIGAAQLFAAALHLPRSAFDALAALRRLKAKNLQIPKPGNLQLAQS